MMDSSGDISNLSHDGERGHLREIFLEELLLPYLGPTMKICKDSTIINSEGEQSDEIDIIIYDSEIIPPALLKKETGIIPVESVLSTIEVKSTLNSTKLQDSIRNAISIKKLGFHECIIKNHSLHHSPSYIFSYSSDLKEKRKTEYERAIENIEECGYKNPGHQYIAPISGICIAKKEYIYFEFDKKHIQDEPVKNMWHTFKNKELYSEILMFISTFIDNCFKIKQERNRMSIKHYIFNNEDIGK